MRHVMLPLILMTILSATAFGDKEIISQYWYGGLEPFEAQRFIEPGVCARCHGEIYEMWDGTLHSRAFDDLLFRAATKLFVGQATDPVIKEDAEHCVTCHNPIAYRSKQIPGSSADYSNVNEVTKRAISCDVCHTIDEIVMTRNASFNADPGTGRDDPGVKRGPRDDAKPMFHEAAYSEIHTSSQICGACHNATHVWYMTKLEGTYDEWFHSPYNSVDPGRRVTCQECHMRQSPGKPSTGMTDRPDYPGSAAVMSDDRPHVYRHSVAGANTLMPGLLGNPEKTVLAEERLKNAAVLELLDPVKREGGVGAVTVRVRNEGAGHMLPTGVTEFRQMWLEIIVKDAAGKVVYTCGGWGENGALIPDTRIFHTVFGDKDGKPTMNVSEAAILLHDHRIAPKGFEDETFVMPVTVKSPVTIRAELKYRSMEPSLVAALLGKKVDVPIITMASTEKTFP